ncbi:MAG: hypothetical protein DCC65_17080 [Planctomycetota bacterium]|nr:MAG: hypothetical protein DCC65_17080 [Planctomycetota bacterium]
MQNCTHSRVPAVTAFALVALYGAASPASAQFVEPGTVVLHTFSGELAGDQFGWVSENLGDITGDGVNDLVITAPGNDTGGSNRGRVYVYNGATGALVFPPIGGALNGGRFGDSVHAAGDVNGDGVTDIIIGSPAASVSRGRVAVHSGADGSEVHLWLGELGGDRFGSDVAGLGDIDGDGRSDLVIGAISHDTAGTSAGRAYVYSGMTAALICSIDGEGAGDAFGAGVAPVGDLNGDNITEFVVGAQSYGPTGTAGTGRAYVYSGADCLLPGPQVPMFVLNPLPSPAALFGQWFVDGGHDVDNDGTPDIYISDYNANRAYVFSGATGSQIRIYSGDGGGGFGIGRMAGDVDQDGWADMLLAAWISPVGATQAGKGFVYSGRTSQVLQTYTHNVAFAQLGFDANEMGDVNGDGRIDFLLTAANDGSARGKAYLVAGNTPVFSKADIDLDGDVDGDDAEALAAVLIDSPIETLHAQRADVNADGQADALDIQAFVEAL